MQICTLHNTAAIYSSNRNIHGSKESHSGLETIIVTFIGDSTVLLSTPLTSEQTNRNKVLIGQALKI